MGIETVQRSLVARQRLELRGRAIDREVKLEAVDVMAQVRRGHHALGFVEDNARLVPPRGRGINLGADLAVTQQHVEADTRQHRAFALLAWRLLVDVAEASRAVCALPTEHRADDELLPATELERLARPLALRVPQKPRVEADAMLRGVRAPYQTAAMSKAQVAQMPLASQPDKAARRDLLGDDGAGVGRRLVAIGRRHLGATLAPRHPKPPMVLH